MLIWPQRYSPCCFASLSSCSSIFFLVRAHRACRCVGASRSPLSPSRAVDTAPAPSSGQPANDNCVDSISLTVNAPAATGTIFNSTTNPFCFRFGADPVGRGVWYLFSGTGKMVTVSTCFPQTQFDSRLAIQAGSCGAGCIVPPTPPDNALPPCTNPFGR